MRTQSLLSAVVVHLLSLSRYPYAGAVFTGLTLGLAAWVTYSAGGTRTVYPHLFYVPIVLAAFFYRLGGGVIVGIAAGLLCGPFMPLDVAAGLRQMPASWMIRAGFFTGVGALTGLFSTALHWRILDLSALNEEAVRGLVRAIDAKDPYTARHSEKVAEFATAIARELGLSPPAVERIRWTALLHDVGKIAIPDAILNKPGDLTRQEWSVVKRHPDTSAEIIRGVYQFQDYVPGVRHHHERVDGRGYPDGLSGEAIPQDARIIAVADAFEALTAERAYRPALSEEEALVEIADRAGTQFEPEVVAGLVRVRARGSAPERVNRPVAG